MKAGHAVIEALRAEGIEYTFGVVGTTTNSIVTEMYGRSDIRFVDTRHEEGAAFMAYGYARASGKPTACITTSGPGTTNLITGIALAYKGRAPVLVIAGDVARDFIYRDGSQAFDLVGMFKPITKLALQVNKTERIPEMLHDAFRAALSGKRGPVFLDIPRDLLDDQTIDGGGAPAIRPIGRWMRARRAIRRRSSARSTLLAQAQRPLLLAGGGVIDAEASNEAVALAELLDMALVPSYGHTDAVPNSHHLYVGPAGGRGSGEAAEAIHRADVILALGTRLNQSTTFWNYSVINPGDPHRAGGHRHPGDRPQLSGGGGDHGGCPGGGRAAVPRPARGLPRRTPEPGVAERGGRAGGAPAGTLAVRDDPHRGADDAAARLPGAAQGAAARLHGDDRRRGRAGTRLRPALTSRCRAPSSTTRGMADWAWGYAVGLGTKLGRPDRPAVSLQGDGGFLYTSQEINTAVRWGIPLVSIVLNNSCHGAEKAQQQRHYGGRYVGVDLVNPRFDKLAEVYGARGAYVERPEEIADAVQGRPGRERTQRDRDSGRRVFPAVSPHPEAALIGAAVHDLAADPERATAAGAAPGRPRDGRPRIARVRGWAQARGRGRPRTRRRRRGAGPP